MKRVFVRSYALMCLLLLGAISVVPSAADEGGNTRTPLMRAALVGDLEVVRKLVAAGADVNATDNGITALFYAAGATPIPGQLHGSTTVLKWLLEHGADPNAKSRGNGYTALMAAADNAHTDRVALLLSRGALIDSKTDDGQTALSVAACRADIDTVALLLEHGARVNGYADRLDGQTPLLCAMSAMPRVSPAILAVPNADALHTAARWYNAKKVVDRLLQAGADANVADRNGNTPLSLAVSENNLDLTRRLLDAGADPNAAIVALGGGTVLSDAARNCHRGIAALLLDRKVNPNATDKQGRTPTQHAQDAGCTRVVRLLQDHLR